MWDVFISHASEDKESFVEVLAKQLKEVYKVNVWYDKFSLEYGDSLLDSIEEGLKQSNYGIVILSKNFFDKKWTNTELKVLRTKEMELSKKVIIPIWYNISREDVYNHSILLSDKLAIQIENDFDIDDLAIKIVKIIRPDIYDNISRMKYVESINKEAKEVIVNYKQLNKIPVPPIRHEKLGRYMEARLKLAYNSIKEVEERTYKQYEEDFRRSVNIDRELIITEMLSAAYAECISQRKMTYEDKLKTYILVQSLGKTNVGFNNDEVKKFNKIIKSYIDEVSSAEILMEFDFDLE